MEVIKKMVIFDNFYFYQNRQNINLLLMASFKNFFLTGTFHWVIKTKCNQNIAFNFIYLLYLILTKKKQKNYKSNNWINYFKKIILLFFIYNYFLIILKKRERNLVLLVIFSKSWRKEMSLFSEKNGTKNATRNNDENPILQYGFTHLVLMWVLVK